MEAVASASAGRASGPWMPRAPPAPPTQPPLPTTRSKPSFWRRAKRSGVMLLLLRSWTSLFCLHGCPACDETRLDGRHGDLLRRNERFGPGVDDFVLMFELIGEQLQLLRQRQTGQQLFVIAARDTGPLVEHYRALAGLDAQAGVGGTERQRIERGADGLQRIEHLIMVPVAELDSGGRDRHDNWPRGLSLFQPL